MEELDGYSYYVDKDVDVFVIEKNGEPVLCSICDRVHDFVWHTVIMLRDIDRDAWTLEFCPAHHAGYTDAVSCAKRWLHAEVLHDAPPTVVKLHEDLDDVHHFSVPRYIMPAYMLFVAGGMR
jgi:hypothetical protein